FAFGSPDEGELPPEIFTAFRAVPGSERQFLQPMLGVRDPEQQQELLNLVSEDMGAILQTAWSYLYGTGSPQQLYLGSEADIPLHHPVMGLGSDVEAYQIRTMEDLRLDDHVAGLGWKQSQLRLNQLLVE